MDGMDIMDKMLADMDTTDAALTQQKAPATASNITEFPVNRLESPVADAGALKGTGTPSVRQSPAEGQTAHVAGKKPLLGLLTVESMTRILEEFNDDYLTMPHFPQFSKMAKIRVHDSVVIAADTGMGKSSLAINFMHELYKDYPAIYFNMEMGNALLLQRLLAIHTGMEIDRIQGYGHDPATREKLAPALRDIATGKGIQAINELHDLKEIEEQIKTVTAGRKEPTLVFIDTALLVKMKGKSNRYERFTDISQDFREMALKYNIIIFLILQQNRSGKNRGVDEAPENSSLKETGSWENDATQVLFLWESAKEKCKMLSIKKIRDGELGDVKLNYVPKTQTYSESKDGFVYNDKTPYDTGEVASETTAQLKSLQEKYGNS